MNLKRYLKKFFKKQTKASLFQILDNEDSYFDVEKISSTRMCNSNKLIQLH